MLQRLVGFGSRAQLAMLVALSLLVALTPLGREATNPIVLGVYRSLLVVIVLVAYAGRKDSPRRICPWFLGAVAALLLLMAVSVQAESGSHFEGFYVLYQSVLFFAAFLALSHFQQGCTRAWKRAALIVVAAVNLCFLAVAFIGPQRPLIATFVNPNYFASFLLAGLGVCVAYGMFGTGARYRVYAFSLAAILYYGIVRSSSRGATLAAVAMLGLAAFRRGRSKGYPIMAILVVGAVVGAATVAASPGLVRKFLDRGTTDPYNYKRPQIWLSSLRMIATHPILGVGPGRYYYHSKLFTPAVEGTLARYRVFPNIAHSEYLQRAAEFGIPAALGMFTLAGYLMWTAWKRAGKMTGESRVFQEAALMTAAGLGVHALVDNNWTVPVMAAGMAVISQADLLPYRDHSFRIEWTPAKRVVLVALILAVFLQSTAIPAVAVYFNDTGHRAFVAGDFDRAELMHSLAVGIVPDHPVFLDNLGMVYFDGFMKSRKAEYLDRAESQFRSSIAANRHFDVPGGHLETALIQRLTGDRQKDRRVHEEIIEADRYVLSSNPFNPFIRMNLAEALYNTGAKGEAVNELLRAVEIEPNFVPGYLRLAQWYAESGQTEASEEYKAKAVQRVLQYQGKPTADPFEALLLGRPQAMSQPQ